MKSSIQTNLALALVAAAVLVGYLFGASHPAAVAADGDKVEPAQIRHGGAIGVSIPSGGAAVVKGKDGFAYIVTPNGLFVKAAQAGKSLELP